MSPADRVASPNSPACRPESPKHDERELTGHSSPFYRPTSPAFSPDAPSCEPEKTTEDRVETAAEENEGDLRSPQSFACPTCRQVITVPLGGVDNFQRNFNMEASVAKGACQELTCDLCDNSSPASSACTECQKLLCLPCLQVHEQVAGAKYHNLTSLSRSGNKASAGSTSRRNRCRAHRNEQLSVYCRKCQVAICTLCHQAAHQDHDTEDAAVAMEKLRAIVRAALKKLEEEVKVADEIMAEAGKAEQDLERQKQAVIAESVETAGKVTAWTNQAEERLVNDVNQVTHPVKDKLQNQKTIARNARAEADRLRDRAKLLIKDGTLAEVSSLTLQILLAVKTLGVRFQQQKSGAKVEPIPFLTRVSAGRELVQNALPKLVGEVRIGPDAEAEDSAMTNTAFGFHVGLSTQARNTFAFHVAAEKTTLVFEQEAQALFELRVLAASTCDSNGRHVRTSTVCTASFSNDGVSLASLPSVPILLCSKSAGLFTGRDWTSVQRTLDATSSLIAVANSVPGERAFCIKSISPGVYDVCEMTADTTGTLTSKPVFQIVNTEDIPCSFDVSADEMYFALLTICDAGSSTCSGFTGTDKGSFAGVAKASDTGTFFFHNPGRVMPAKPSGAAAAVPGASKTTKRILCVSVYRRMQAQPCSVFRAAVPGGFQSYGDLCFSIYEGKEMLRVADRQNDLVYVLDHRKDCDKVHRMGITKPAALATDPKGRVWIACETGNVIVFTP